MNCVKEVIVELPNEMEPVYTWALEPIDAEKVQFETVSNAHIKDFS